MSDVVDVGSVTALVLSRYADELLPVGDGVAPEAGGWASGQPGVSVFVPYAVVGFGGGAVADTSLCSNGRTWRLSYDLRYWGGSRRQCDWAATTGRRQVDGCHRESFVDETTGRSWLVYGLRWAGLGSVSRYDQTDPPFWQARDVLELMVGPA